MVAAAIVPETGISEGHHLRVSLKPAHHLAELGRNKARSAVQLAPLPLLSKRMVACKDGDTISYFLELGMLVSVRDDHVLACEERL